MVNVIDCDFVVSEFELQWRYYVHFQTKVWISLSPNYKNEKGCYCLSLASNNTRSLICHWTSRNRNKSDYKENRTFHTSELVCKTTSLTTGSSHKHWWSRCYSMGKCCVSKRNTCLIIAVFCKIGFPIKIIKYKLNLFEVRVCEYLFINFLFKHSTLRLVIWLIHFREKKVKLLF